MRDENRIAVIIPALNEEAAIPLVLAAIPPWVDEVVVVDNGSTDATPEVAQKMGARVRNYALHVGGGNGPAERIWLPG